jgi:hypothetical protein
MRWLFIGNVMLTYSPPIVAASVTAAGLSLQLMIRGAAGQKLAA